MNASPIFSIALGTARKFSGPVASNMRQTIVQKRRSAHSAARAAHARILLSYEDQLYHQAE